MRKTLPVISTGPAAGAASGGCSTTAATPARSGIPLWRKRRLRIALVRHHDLCLNTRQIARVQKRAGVLPHLGLGYIHTALKSAGFHDVIQVDTPALGLDSEGLRKLLADFEPDLVGVSTTTPGLPGAIEACEAASSTGAKVILGGPHTEVYAHENLVHESIDYIGVGEGITIMPELAEAMERGEDPEGIRGLVTRKHDGGAAPMVNLEEVGWPERSGLPMDRYYSIMAPRPFATMISSRGCPFKCSFCFKQAVDKKSMYRSPEDVVGEMTELKERWGVKEIMFYDDVFTLHRGRVREICALINEKGLKVRWEAPTRVDLVPEPLLEAMAGAGCVRLRFGIEHGDSEILERMRKESDIQKIEKAVTSAHKAGIKGFGYFIVGWLDETREQFGRTVDLACRLPLDYASFYTATPLPGTPLHTESVAAGQIPSDYWDRFVRGEFDARIGYLVPDAQERAQRAYRSFFMRRSMIRPLVSHMAATGQWRNTLDGLRSLHRSTSNTDRDF
ncbi:MULTISPECIES: B12-binding domain-containing radical SAM protein [unclassified Streptomyces]|uniref:B12-binding domain-containing radical SAM protein n=1 Tax=unclassified Streptomyces TaxID=2593676 RepID=UPI0024427B62|nr:radical SAM protein [Streptomyces sp. DH41]MDG9726994.1 radical SAM protein [Streptomyces sp. DH41]